MGGMFLTSLCIYIYIYIYLFIYICFDSFVLIIRLNYLRDNSVIFLESSYWRDVGLR
jgi:hypothetical protein